MKIKCPDCEEITEFDDWTDGETGCEDCGSHPALVCPACGIGTVDLIFNGLEDFEYIDPTESPSVAAAETGIGGSYE
ncbi:MULTISPECIES: hypothetical protein [Paenibacillus]|uniref:Uncharacterized protein n=1 Tax=Paenibacillus odorifer TaxID=189426 RepID=A0ABX3HYM4_9BACL|nr:hypothetical protein [Paenibacillus odorifer]OMD55281.1 hypothetical protein BSK51_04300 [Paenibacillus odorifer]